MACLEVFAAGDCLAPTAEQEARVGIVDVVVGGRNNLMFYYWNGYILE